MKITLLGHSGFLVEGDSACLVFDLFTDAEGLVDKLPFGIKPVLFFASHSHGDHYNKRILDFAGQENVGYVLGEGIRKPSAAKAVVMGKGQAAEMLGVKVRAFGSTDAGVSFLVELDGKKLFHAGDLNDWYWEEESTAKELLRDEQRFLDELALLENAAPDVAFFPVDARLGRHALRGALHFARIVKPGQIVPMHLCGGLDLPRELAQKLAEEGLVAKAASIAEPGDNIEI